MGRGQGRQKCLSFKFGCQIGLYWVNLCHWQKGANNESHAFGFGDLVDILPVPSADSSVESNFINVDHCWECLQSSLGKCSLRTKELFDIRRRGPFLACACDDGTSKWPQAASATICDINPTHRDLNLFILCSSAYLIFVNSFTNAEFLINQEITKKKHSKLTSIPPKEVKCHFFAFNLEY